MKTRFIHYIVAVLAFVALGLSLITCGEDNSNPSGFDTENTIIDTTGDTTIDTTGDTSGDTTGDTTIDTSSVAIVADHYAVAGYDSLTPDQITTVQSDLNIFYGHTSHGSQIVTGLNMLHDENSSMALPAIHEISDDLGHNGDTTWVAPTRAYLDAHPECNVVMWSWCGGCSDNTAEGINIYLNALASLEAEYPSVIFIYMTGHLDGTGVDGVLYACNNQIRDYCAANEKILFDFADIESYDPDGNYYPDATDACEWASDWCATHDCPDCSYCAHSHCFNCYLKGKAMWWLMARLVD